MLVECRPIYNNYEARNEMTRNSKITICSATMTINLLSLNEFSLGLLGLLFSLNGIKIIQGSKSCSHLWGISGFKLPPNEYVHAKIA